LVQNATDDLQQMVDIEEPEIRAPIAVRPIGEGAREPRARA
jgi:hypothetical protein